MQNIEQTYYLENLKEAVEQEFGKKLKYSKDCRLLSRQIFEVTGRQLSVSTIKRFFGIIPSPFNPSKYTLETFSVFLGFETWNSYINSNNTEELESKVKDGWDLLRENVQLITETSLHSLSQKTRYNVRQFIKRECAEDYFEEFFLSEKTAAILIAPKGYGKSSMLMQWHNAHFSGNDSRFNQDVVCLIDGGMFFTFFNQSQNNKILDQLIDFDVKLNQEIFSGIADTDQKRRYLLIIDDVDKIFSVREKNYLLVGNIMQLILINKNHSWFKVILTCKPENLDMFTSLVLQNPQFAKSFYKVSFFFTNHLEAINVPLFSRKEIQLVLDNFESILSFHFLSLYYPEIFKVLNMPLFLSFFIRDGDFPAPDFSEIGFYNQLIHHHFYSHPFIEEKQILIKKFLQLCNMEEDITSVGKELLLEETDCQLAYRELIKSGIIYEYLDSSDLPHIHMKVRFSNKEVFGYLLVRTLMKNRNMEISLLNSLFTKLRNNISIQYGLLKWLIKIAFYDRNEGLLKQVHLFLERKVNISSEITGEVMPGSLRSVQNAFAECLRSNSSLCEVLMPWFAKSRLGRKLYFEEYFDMDNLMFFPEKSLEVYARNNQSAESEMVIRFIRFIKGYYSLDFETCSAEYEQIKKINYSELASAYSLGYYFSTYFLYASFKNSHNNKEMLKDVILTSEKLRLKNPQPFRFIPSFDFFLVYNLNTCDSFEEIKAIAEHVDHLYEFSQMKASPFYHFYKLCLARSFLNTGKENRAMELFQQIKTGDFPYHMRHFMQMNVNLALVDFMEYQKKTAEAMELLSEAKSLARHMGYNLFVQKTAALESKLHKKGKDIPNK